MAQDQTESDQHPKRLALRAFIGKRKFLAEPLYPGATNEATREKCQAVIDALAERLIPLADAPVDQRTFAKELTQTMLDFGSADSEERERAASYVEEVMDILEIESSGGLLNMWAYGFDPAELLAKSPNVPPR